MPWLLEFAPNYYDSIAHAVHQTSARRCVGTLLRGVAEPHLANASPEYASPKPDPSHASLQSFVGITNRESDKWMENFSPIRRDCCMRSI
jgi:hypothetical protein